MIKFGLKQWLIALFVIALEGLICYGIARNKFKTGIILEEELTKTFFIYFGIVAGITIIIVLVLFILSNYSNNRSGDIPKEIVDVEPALTCFMEEFIKHTGVPYLYDYSGKEPEVKPLREDDVQVREIVKFPHPKTGNPFLRFELNVKSGRYFGLNQIFIRLDSGVKYIKKNWRERIFPHTPIETYKHSEKHFPLDTFESEEVRIELVKAQLMEEGLTAREVKYLEALKPKHKPETDQPEIPEEVMEARAEALQIQNMQNMEKIKK